MIPNSLTSVSHYTNKEKDELEIALTQWINQAPNDEKENRRTAVKEISRRLSNLESRVLDLGDLGLTTVPPLPSDLGGSLNLSGNKFTSLAGMPDEMNALEKLYITDNPGLKSLAGMPDEMNALKKLYITDNPDLESLDGMPDEMNALEKLYITDNPDLESLDGIPPEMKALKHLKISDNRTLASLAGLPDEMNALEMLEIKNNRTLMSLAGLPLRMNALKTLAIIDNTDLASLAGLPPHLNTVETLDIIYNPALTSLTGLPQQMNAVERLNICNNSVLVSLDGIPPSTLDNPAVSIDLQGCSLSSETIAAISRGDYHAMIYFDMIAHDTGNRPEKSLDEEVDAWLGPESGAPWKGYATTQEGKALATLLMRLHGCAAFTGADKAGSVADLKQILDRMQQDKTFRDYCFAAVQASDANCHDNVQAIFDELRLLLANPALREGATLQQVIAYQRGQLALKWIDHYVATLGQGGDPLESGQELKRLLSGDPDLQLPITFKDIKYAATGVISNAPDMHKKAAKEHVLNHLTNEALAKEMAEDAPCAAFLKTCYPATFAAHHLLWNDVMEKLQDKETNLVNEDERLQDLQKETTSLTAAEALDRAQALPGWGAGKLFQAFQEKALKDVLTTIANHALTHPTLDPEARKTQDVEMLLGNKAWVGYLIAQKFEPVASSENDALIRVKRDLTAWTSRALKEGADITVG